MKRIFSFFDKLLTFPDILMFIWIGCFDLFFKLHNRGDGKLRIVRRDVPTKKIADRFWKSLDERRRKLPFSYRFTPTAIILLAILINVLI